MDKILSEGLEIENDNENDRRKLSFASDGRRLFIQEKQTLSFSLSNRCAPKNDHVGEAHVIVAIRIDTNSTMNLT